ncbi:MAG TPA: hypothetical protein VGK09_09095 [Rhodocyclaceae bacterium]
MNPFSPVESWVLLWLEGCSVREVSFVPGMGCGDGVLWARPVRLRGWRAFCEVKKIQQLSEFSWRWLGFKNKYSSTMRFFVHFHPVFMVKIIHIML